MTWANPSTPKWHNRQVYSGLIRPAWRDHWSWWCRYQWLSVSPNWGRSASFPLVSLDPTSHRLLEHWHPCHIGKRGHGIDSRTSFALSHVRHGLDSFVHLKLVRKCRSSKKCSYWTSDKTGPCTTVRNSDNRKYWPSNDIICNSQLVALDLFSATNTNFPLDNFLVNYTNCCSGSWFFFGQICKLLFHFCKNCEWLI